MNLIIKKMHLENFKGIKDRTIDFTSPITKIEGKNATGKTTLATAYFWLFSNTDYDLRSNPAIFPTDIEECTPSVEIEMNIDDKPVSIRKTQTRKVTESNGTRKVALTNTYSVNSVPMAERDMQKKLSDMGFDFEKFSLIANPNAFLVSKKDEQRKLLFSMASSLTDLEVAQKTEGFDEATKLLESYTMDEIRAMQKATLDKINKDYGRKGEILTARIEGLELSKTDIDFSEQELNRNLINEKLSTNADAQRACELMENELADLRGKNMQLQFEISGLRSKAQAEKQAEENKLLANRREVEEKANSLDRDIKRMQNEVTIYEDAFKRSENEKKLLEKKITEAKALVMDESKTRCPVCNRVYAESKIATIRSNFEKDRKIMLDVLEEQLKENASLTAIKKSELADLNKKLKKAIDSRAELETVLQQPVNALQGNMPEPDVYGEQIARLESDLETLNRLMGEKKNAMPNMTTLKAEELKLQDELKACEIMLSKADDNARIDTKIAELRNQQMIFEQNRANAEKILFQLDEIQKAKNKLLTEEINKHFKLVRWEMFSYLKNGNYTETCTCWVGDKELGAALNNAMQIQAKIDICDSLQRFFDIHVPIFLDNAEALDSENQDRLQAETQLILLSVKEI